MENGGRVPLEEGRAFQEVQQQEEGGAQGYEGGARQAAGEFQQGELEFEGQTSETVQIMKLLVEERHRRDREQVIER